MKNQALIISLIGILILLFIINSAEPKNTEISSINEKMINKNIKITGEVTSLKSYENNFTIITLKDKTGEIEIICTCLEIKENSNLEAIGKVGKYKQEFQLEADKIKIFKIP